MGGYFFPRSVEGKNDAKRHISALGTERLAPRRHSRALRFQTAHLAAGLKHQGAHAHEVGNVGDGSTFSGLLVMQARSELQRNLKSPGQEGGVLFHGLILRRWAP